MFLFNDYTFRIVAIGAIIIGILGGISGSYAVLRKQSLLGDSIAHASLAGIAVSYMLTQTKSTEVLLLGALVIGLIATYIINFFVRHAKVNFDSSLAIVMTMFFGIGLMLLTQIQKTPDSNQAGLDRFLFGQAATIRNTDVQLSFIVLLITIVIMIIFWKPLKVYTFNPEYAKTIGYNTSLLSFILSSFVVTSVIIGIQMVGVVLMSSLLIAPGVAALQWSKSFKSMVILSGVVGGLGGLGGTIISSSYDKFPTGPAIVVVMSIMVFLSLLFSPYRGLVFRKIKEKRAIRNMESDMIMIHYFAHHNHPLDSSFLLEDLDKASIQEHNINHNISSILTNLKNRDLVTQNKNTYLLTDLGMEYFKQHVKGDTQ